MECLRVVAASWIGTSVKEPDGDLEVRVASGFSESSLLVAMLVCRCMKSYELERMTTWVKNFEQEGCSGERREEEREGRR